MDNLPTSVKNFVSSSIFRYALAGYRVTIHPGEMIKVGGLTYTGEATPEKLEIAIGGGLDKWLGIFVHETCHLDQHIEKREVFEIAEDALSNVTRWIEGKLPSPTPVEDFWKVVENEADCERRSVEKIRLAALPLNEQEYISKANVYLGSYAVSMRHRVWIAQPYNRPELCALAESSRILSPAEVVNGNCKLPTDEDYMSA